MPRVNLGFGCGNSVFAIIYTYKNLSGRIRFIITTPIFPRPFHRWHYLSLHSFLAFLVSLLCTGGVANVNSGFFLRGLGSFLLLEAFFQCPPEPNGRRSQSGGKNIVRVSLRDSLQNINLMPCTDSDIIYVNALGTSIVILNSYEAAVDLLDKRSGIYSSR